MSQVVAREAAAIGVNQIFGPVSDVARELRYGRVNISYRLFIPSDILLNFLL